MSTLQDHADPIRVRLGRRLAGLALLGVALAATLLLVSQHFGAAPLPGCGPGSDCERAAASRWGSIAGWPVAFLGLAYFSALALVWMTVCRRGVPVSFRFLVRVGAGLSVVFTGVMVLESQVCVYCAVAHAANLAFWLLLEGSRRWPVPGLRCLVGVAGLFLVISGTLYVLKQQAHQSASRQAEDELQDSIKRILAATKDQESNGTSPAGDFAERYRLGPENAPIRLVIFSDYECSYCDRLDADAQALCQQRSDVALVVKHYPLCTDCNYSLPSNLHPNACRAARAAEAAGILKGNLGFWEMHAWLMARQGKFTDEELKAGLQGLGYEDPERFLGTMNGEETLRRIRADLTEAKRAGVTGTPRLFINGVELRRWDVDQAVERAVQAVADQLAAAKSGAVDNSKEFSTDAQIAAVTATVRLVNMPAWTHGSGAIIGRTDGYVYILTANHVLEARADLEVYTYSLASYPKAHKIYKSAQVVARLKDEDLALVRVATNDALPGSVRICPAGLVPRETPFHALTVGYTAGEAPTWEADTVEAKKLGIRAGAAPVYFWECSRPPVKGRSGGPLIDKRGYLIGVCNGSNDGKGYYCHTDAILSFLSKSGISLSSLENK